VEVERVLREDRLPKKAMKKVVLIEKGPGN
jgi:hypothetical protein